MYDTILVPTDGSETAMRAVRHALDIASRYGATVHALSVVDIRDLGLTTPTEVDVEDLSRRVREDARAAVDAISTAGEEVGVPVVSAIEIGVLHRTILEYAAAHEVDLIVMGTHGRTGLPHAILGSVTERIVRLSPVPVLTVGPVTRDDE